MGALGVSARTRWPILAFSLAIALLVPGVAPAAFPGTDPDESPRLNAPDDPDFDLCESDDAPDAPGSCTSYFDEQYQLFGFSPDSAVLAPPAPAHPPYADCPVDPTGTPQLDAQGRQANTLGSEAQQCAQISGVRADTAWKYFGKYDAGGPVGNPDVVIAILDTGIRWQDPELRTQVHLNADELPTPHGASGLPCTTPDPAGDDCNDDGAFNVADFADDSRVQEDEGDDEADSVLDGSDLIAEFSNGDDADGNGYVDDIAGWDFFDDDNDPFDASSCCSAGGHGTGRAREAAADTNNDAGDAGLCPDCQIMPLRVWDTFVVPTDFYAMAVDYATRTGATVVEGAVGGLTNTQFARRVFQRADEQGLSLMLVSSDINSANHNYPTNYNEAMYVAGAIPDTAPFGACDGTPSFPGFGDPTDFFGDAGEEFQQQFEEGCEAFLAQLQSASGVTPTAQPTTTSFFRNSNLTQYGGKADIVLMGSTGSENTGQSSGAAGLVHSFGRLMLTGDGAGGTIPDNPGPPQLSGNELRQLLTMTAEDVQPENTGVIGQADRAEEGWDTHFGYGRVNLANALARVSNDPVGPDATPPTGWPCDLTGPGEDPNCIPPEAQLDSPDWFSPINVERAPAGGVPIRGMAAAPHSGSGVGQWTVEIACGQQPVEADFEVLATGTGAQPHGSLLATIPKTAPPGEPSLEDLAANCDGSVANDPGRPAGTTTEPWPANPYPNPDPEQHAFTIRLTVEDADNPGNLGQYRKTLFAYEDDGNLGGWPRPVGTGSDATDYVTGSGGEQSTRLYDIDGDNELDVLMPTSSGELWALDSGGNPINSFGGDGSVETDPFALAQAHPPSAGLPSPGETLRTPAIGDVAGDVEPEIVAAAGEHVYAWQLDGDEVPGFPVRINPALSEPCKSGVPKPCFHPEDRAITSQNHIKRGFLGSAVLADLDLDGSLDIVAGSLDQHVYAWDGSGERMPGFPRKLSTAGAAGAEIITTPAIAQLDGDPRPEIVAATNEVVTTDPAPPDNPFQLLNVFLGAATGANPVYAINDDGSAVDGWPVEVGVAAGDLLPLVLPGHDAAVVDVDEDGVDEVSVSAATSLEGQGSRLVNGDGSTNVTYVNDGVRNTPDQGPVLNLADYTSIGDVLGAGTPSAVKGGLTVNGVANLLAVNQNLPFSHVEQAWDLNTGAAVPGYPRATDDFQLLSQAPIARVGGTGIERQVLVGTGMYQLHAYGPAGIEPAGWPKFSGGWMQPTPAVGDADGDGDLDVTGYTREGWSFLWDTDPDRAAGGSDDGVDACDDSNEEWWTFHHDEHSSANYGTDARPPGTPEGLAAQRSGSTVTLGFTAPGDDWMCGTADKLRVIASASPIQHPVTVLSSGRRT